MAVLRNGKSTNQNNRKVVKKSNFNKKLTRELCIKLKRLSPIEIEKLTKTPAQRYNLRMRVIQTTQAKINKDCVSSEKKLASLSRANEIWSDLVNRQYELYPSEIILAKMNNFRPWPARVNSIYKVSGVLKCYVSFFGTNQIGSVLKNQCVSANDCHLYLFHAVKEIKTKYRWDLDYERLSQTNELERSIALAKLTQVQTFLLAVRDMERVRGIPFDLSVLKGQIEL